MAFVISEVTALSVASAATFFFFLCTLTVSLYRTYFHPLTNYPGPTLWAISQLPSAFNLLSGNLPYRVAELHRKYGPVIRIAPNELSYINEEAWLDIYGKPSPRNTQLRKDTSQFIGTGTGVYGLVMEPDDTDHARMRRNLSHGFSEKALRDQEPIMTRYFDLLIRRLHENCENPLDMVKWYNLMSFDIIGDLTFGESFDCLETSKMHFWVQMIFGALRAVVVLGLSVKFHPLDKLLVSLAPKSIRKEEMKHRELTEVKLKKRLESIDPRQDFLVYAQQHLDTPAGMTYQELFTTISALIVAGSETTGTLLSGVTYYLLMNPTVLAKLATEVRSAFKAEEEITITSVNNLSYALAVLNEALRIYPPTPASLPRMTPPEGCQIAGRYVPGNVAVAVNQWSAFHSTANFSRPYEFIPERWLGAKEFEGENRKVVQPFSVGPRSCIGRNLAYAEMRVVLARVVWGFDMELCEESKGWDVGQKVFLVYEKRPLMVKLKPVKR